MSDEIIPILNLIDVADCNESSSPPTDSDILGIV